jgi:hypothetical protein
MNLGLGVIAGNSFFDQNKANEDRAYVQKQRDYQSQLMQSGLDTLPDQTAATRSQYQMTAAKNTAGLDTLPAETQLKQSKLGLEQGDTAFKQEQQPILQATETDTNTVKKATADQDILMLPRTLAQRAASGAVDAVKAKTALIAALGDTIQMGDPEITKQFVQSAFDSGLFEEHVGKKVGAVGVRKDASGQNVFVAQDTAGNPLFEIGASALEHVRASRGKNELKTLKPGETLVNVKDGKANTLATAPESITGRNQHTPAEVQTAEWLMKNKVATDANDAWSKVRSAREKTKPAFIADLMKGSIMPGMRADDVKGMEKNFGDMYDRLHVGGPGLPNPAPSNNPAAPTISPQIKDLIGIP